MNLAARPLLQGGSGHLEPVSRWWQLAVLVCVFTIAPIVAQFEPVAMAEAVGGSAGIILYLAISFWPVRAHGWFWIFLAAVTAAHVAAIVLIHWPEHRRWAKGDTLFGVVDFYAIWGLGAAFEHWWNKSHPSSQPEGAATGGGA